MQWADFVIVGVVLSLAAGAVNYIRKHKSSCGGCHGCDGCKEQNKHWGCGEREKNKK